jgi:hypothetical protein
MQRILVFGLVLLMCVTFSPDAAAAQVSLTGDVASNIRAIYADGLAKGNRPNVFSKVGDSSTASYNFLGPIGDGTYDLGDYGYLQGVIDFYSEVPVGTGNSFNNQSRAASVGWSAAVLTNPAYTPTGCRAAESPLRCEYRTAQPSVALIMVGNNEVTYLSVEDYMTNMQRVIDLSVEMGVIPVISTIHNRRGNTEKVDAYNNALRQLAAQNRVPLWDYAAALVPLPNKGLTADETHPNSPPGDWYRGTATFSEENLQYGFTMRNLTALQVLEAVRGGLG